MTSNDLLFLVIFIIVPTAAVVSGFWYLLVVRRAPSARRAARPKDEQPAEDDAIVTADAATTLQSAETVEPVATPSDPVPDAPVILVDLNTVDFDESADAGAIDDVSPMTADLLSDSDLQAESEYEDLGIPDEDERRALWEEIEQSPAGLTATEEIPELEDEVADDLEAQEEELPLHERNPTEQWEIDEEELQEAEDDEIASPDSAEDSTEDPADDEDAGDDLEYDDTDDDEGDDEDDGESRQRARLIPTEPAQRPKGKRSRHSGRRVPRISRLRRNEGRVERGDGPDDVPL